MYFFQFKFLSVWRAMNLFPCTSSSVCHNHHLKITLNDGYDKLDDYTTAEFHESKNSDFIRI